MFEEFIPKRKIGVLSPRSVIDNQPSEFYRLAPPGIMLVMVPSGLREFSREDVERVFASVDERLEMLMERGIDLVMQAGVPLPILIGIEAHDRLIAHMEEKTGLPATSSVLNVVAAAKHLGIENIAVVNKWTDEMNNTLGEFFAREGIAVAGVANRSMTPAEFTRISSAGSVDLAYGLGRQAFEDYPEADGLYIGGGNWISQPVAERLEEEFDKPAYCNQGAMIWECFHRLDCWQPIPGHGRLLA